MPSCHHECQIICQIYFSCPSKSPKETIGKARCSKNWKAIGLTFCLSHSKQRITFFLLPTEGVFILRQLTTAQDFLLLRIVTHSAQQGCPNTKTPSNVANECSPHFLNLKAASHGSFTAHCIPKCIAAWPCHQNKGWSDNRWDVLPPPANET